ncbi:Imidazole glycerol phosphate synthase hisHF [Diplonema papillatum]|nr:Imidazole glycerol phosphate synthase hisHF [Diplonema papillatum]
MTSKKAVAIVDYGAGNMRSVINAVEYLGWEVILASTPTQVLAAEKLIFPGVGQFGSAVERLNNLGLTEPIKQYIATGKPFMGVCVGMQMLFESSDESPGAKGLGIIPGKVTRFAVPSTVPVPQMGWNGVRVWKKDSKFVDPDKKYYFVHSYVAAADQVPPEWILTTSDYGGQQIVSSVCKDNVFATQFHPEKSSVGGLDVLSHFLEGTAGDTESLYGTATQPPTELAKRVIACLDVRTNDEGDIVVTKGDQYACRESGGTVRNLGRPVDLAERYYLEGADEITFLNITSFRNSPLQDLPMLEVLRQASKKVFVPLCVGGGIRSFTDPDGTYHSAVEVAGQYFKSGADKISLGTDAVAAAQALMNGEKAENSITSISSVYGAQAVVVSVDPKRVYCTKEISDTTPPHAAFPALTPGPSGEKFCWYQCTVKGGRETADMSARELAVAVETLGAGEILLNCIDHDGQNNGFETALTQDVKHAVKIPVIASSGAGKPEHFTQVFRATNADAALAAGIFHRKEVSIEDVKKELVSAGITVRV